MREAIDKGPIELLGRHPVAVGIQLGSRQIEVAGFSGLQHGLERALGEVVAIAELGIQRLDGIAIEAIQGCFAFGNERVPGVLIGVTLGLLDASETGACLGVAADLGIERLDLLAIGTLQRRRPLGAQRRLLLEFRLALGLLNHALRLIDARLTCRIERAVADFDVQRFDPFAFRALESPCPLDAQLGGVARFLERRVGHRRVSCCDLHRSRYRGCRLRRCRRLADAGGGDVCHDGSRSNRNRDGDRRRRVGRDGCGIDVPHPRALLGSGHDQPAVGRKGDLGDGSWGVEIDESLAALHRPEAHALAIGNGKLVAAGRECQGCHHVGGFRQRLALLATKAA